MAERSGERKFTLFDAQEAINEADKTRQNLKTAATVRLAKSIAARPGGLASLDEMMFAIHGFTVRNAQTDEEHIMGGKYERQLARFGNKEGQPVAYVSQRYDRQDRPDGTGSPLWIGRMASVEIAVIEQSDQWSGARHVGTMTLKLTDVHMPVWDSTAPSASRYLQPTMSDAHAHIVRQPEMDVPLAQGFCLDDFPGTLNVADDKKGAFAVGFGGILARSGDLDMGNAESQLLCRRIADVMEALEHPQ